MSASDFSYRGYVGPEERYYLVGRQVLELLLSQGLREHHRFLDIGCGSLRLGRLLIPFLMAGKYCGLEPAADRVQEGLRHEVAAVFGQRLVEVKQPAFAYNGKFDLSTFGGQFDYILAFAVFIHCGRAQLETCLRTVRDVMGPSSVFFLDLAIEERSREAGRHRKYAAASHQRAAYSRQDAEQFIERAGFSHRIVELDAHPADAESRTVFALSLG